MKTSATPGGPPIEVFDGIRANVPAERPQFFEDLTPPFYGCNRPGAEVSAGVRESLWLQGMQAVFPAAYFCIKARSDTDLADDVKKSDGPALILHGDDDQIVPYADPGLLPAKLLKNGTFKTCQGLPHGMPTTEADTINCKDQDLIWRAVSDHVGGEGADRPKPAVAAQPQEQPVKPRITERCYMDQ
ncbi:MAG: alpha/beta hydrolase [Burkholderiales bacterium]